MPNPCPLCDPGLLPACELHEDRDGQQSPGDHNEHAPTDVRSVGNVVLQNANRIRAGQLRKGGQTREQQTTSGDCRHGPILARDLRDSHIH